MSIYLILFQDHFYVSFSDLLYISMSARYARYTEPWLLEEVLLSLK